MSNIPDRDKSNKKDKQFFYLCESCLDRFSLPTAKLSINPYPKISGSPQVEVLYLCFKCRARLNKEFSNNFIIK